MDSGNSGSMQSSSGGDDEYGDSRAESISAFLSHSGNLTSLSRPPPPPPANTHHHHPPTSSLFDPLSNYLDAFTRSPPPSNYSNHLLNTSWNRGGRAPDVHPDCTGIGGLMGSSPSPQTPSIPGPIGPFRGASAGTLNINPPPPPPGLLDHQPNVAGTAAAPRSSKKRSRASRRAPTTVLTTDTSNFRAMVQEFTGIPSPPFSSSPFPMSGRFDLFHAAASASSTAMRSSHVPPYLLRPFAQKAHQQVPISLFGTFASSSSSGSSSSSPSAAIVDTIASITTTTRTTTNTSSNSTNALMAPITCAATTNTTTTASTACTNSTSLDNNYQLPSDLVLGNQHQNLLNMQSPMFNFQSLLQSPPTQKYNYPNELMGGGGGGGGVDSPQGLSMLPSGAAADYTVSGIGHGQVIAHSSMLPNLIASEGMPLTRAGGGGGDDILGWMEGSGSDGGDQGQFRPVSGNYGHSQRVNSCKMKYTASAPSSDFQAETRSTENVSTRGEGMVDSWICSSD